MKIEDTLSFIKEIDLLKKIERQTLLHTGERRENSAEHSWHLAVVALVLQSFAPKDLDINKAIKMAILHDIVEIYAGDTFVYSDLTGKQEAELQALEKLISLLPPEISNTLKEVWQEFEKGESIEAKYISAIDRFLPVYSNYLNQGYSWKKHGINYSKIVDRCEDPISSGLPELWQLTKKMLEESVAKGDLKS